MELLPSSDEEAQNGSLPGFDIDGAMKNLQCDLQTFKRILLTFYRQRKDNYNEITNFLSQGDIEHVSDIVHGIKGSCGYLGAWRLYNEAADMQKACESGDISAVEDKLLRFQASFKEVMDGLKRLDASEK
jgi:HPt (histidine-containing phosphotransfer) domain-containing protein